jgi:ABC-type multidrug transport system ATPase subunit
MAEPNVLLLDEPTNDLDIDTLQELESLLDGWAGTLVVISHDRYLIERICDSTWALFGDGKLTNLPGGIQQYLDRRRELIAAPADVSARSSSSSAEGAAAADAASSPGLSAQEDRELKKELNALERKMHKLSAKVDTLTAKLADAAAPADGQIDTELLADLDRELQGVRSEHDDCEMRWLEVAEMREEGHA